MQPVLHSFPNPEKERIRFNNWLYKIGGDILSLQNEHIYKFRRVCRAHFELKHLCRNNRLCNIAVPNLNIPGLVIFYFYNMYWISLYIHDIIIYS